MAAFPSIGFTSMTMRLRSATSISQSPFTYDQQVFQHQGGIWEAEISLPPLKRTQAKQVEAFFASLRGQADTFTLGNPLHNTTATGAITSGTQGATTVTGTTTGAVAGDYFDISNQLYILPETGGGSLNIMPPLRTAIGSSTSLDFTLPKGTWRLASNEIGWSIDSASIYGFTFACIEAI